MNISPNELILAPGRAVLQRVGSGGLERLLDVAGPGANGAGLTALFDIEAIRADPIRVLVSDAWVRYDLIPVDTSTMEEEEARLLAEAHFLRQYGAPAWPLRVGAQAGGLLVAGLSPELLAAFETLQSAGKPAPTIATQGAVGAGLPALKGRVRLAGVEPVFSWLMDQARETLRSYTGWLLVDEVEILVLAFLERGKLVSIRSQYCGEDRMAEMLGLLERQAALESSKETSILWYSAFGEDLNLPDPWQAAPLSLPVRSAFSRLSSFLMRR